jgi:transposase InsO family protein
VPTARHIGRGGCIGPRSKREPSASLVESFFATLERELLNRRRFKSQAEAKMAVFEWIEGWYNPHRRHSSLGYRSPVNYERAHQRSIESGQSFCRLRRQTALAVENA